MPLLPSSTNAQYAGSRASAWCLGVVGALTILPGCIHYFLPDGGAGVIAGIDLGASRPTVVGVFAWMGAMQIPHGIAEVAVAVRYRTLVPLLLLLALLERLLMAVAGWITKPSEAGHHPPEHYASLLALPVLALFLALSLRRTDPEPRLRSAP